MKLILTFLKAEIKKEIGVGQLLEGLKEVLVTILGQNMENMMTLVIFLKESFKKMRLLLLVLLLVIGSPNSPSLQRCHHGRKI